MKSIYRICIQKYVALFALGIGLFFPIRLFSQFDRLKNYNVKDGLPSSETFGVMQDHKGYMWVIGDMGVSKFNGYGFKNLSIENGLPDNTLFGLYEDKKNRMWFRSFSGKLSFYQNDSIQTLECNDSIGKLFKYVINSSIYVDEGDTIWIGMSHNFILKIKPGWRAKDLEKINVPDGKYIYTIGKEGFVFGGNSPEHITITAYNTHHKKIFSIDPGITNTNKESLRYYLTRLTNGTYLASIDKSIINFNSETVLFKREEKTAVIHLLEDKDNSIMAATYNGISILTGKGYQISKHISQLSNKIITGICIDSENELWFTTEGHGLYCLSNRNFKYYTPENGISESKISCIGPYKTSIITGHLDGTITILNKDSIKTISVNPIENSSAQVTRITGIFNQYNQTYISTVRNTFLFTNAILKAIPKLEKTGVKKLIESKDGNIWAVNYSHLVKYNPRQSYATITNVDLESRVDNIFEDSNGIVWLCAINGVYTYDGKLIRNLGTSNKLLGYRPVDIAEAHDKSIWIATRGGGIIIKKGEELTQITEEKGLAGNMCKSIFIDSNIIWVGTNKGLSKITVSKTGNYTIENLYAKNGLLTNEVNSIIKYNDELWLAHNNGLSVFNPSNIENSPFSPPVYILQALINDSALKENELKRLKYDQNYLTINYIGLSYKDAGNVEYKYKMSGIDSNWIYTRYTSVKYRTIPPGTYNFYVYAKSNDGYWSDKAATLSIVILPAWWQTWVFKITFAATLLLLLFLILKRRFTKIRKREQEKVILHKRIAETELHALRSQMNPHFIYNAINSVQYFITDNDPDSSQKYLAKFAKLIRYVVDNSKPASIPLKTEIEALNLYLELESLRFESRFEYSINLDEGIDVNYTQIPSMLIQPYVENAIWHGLMHKKGHGKIEISLSMKDNVLMCVIKDNGIGRKKSQEIKLSNGSVSHKSVGMSITKDRLEIINQINNAKLSVVISDLVNEQNETNGTCVELSIPFY